MDKQAINAWRLAHGLTVDTQERKMDAAKQRRQDANRAARAQACRDLKSKRTGRCKANDMKKG